MSHDRGGTPATSLMSISGSNIDVAVETFGSLYAGSQLYGRPMSEDFWFKYVGIGDAQLSMRRMRLDGYLRGDIAAEGDVVVQWVSRGHARIDAVDTPAHHRSSPTLFPIRRQFPIEYENVDQRLVHVREDLLRDVASEHTASEHTASPNPPTADAATPPNDVRIARWRANVTQAVVAYRAGGVASPMWDEAKRNVARALLGLYPAHAHLPPAVPGNSGDARLQAALDYLHDHAHGHVSVADVAAAAGTSVRSLQVTFRRTFQRPPLIYFRDMRLDKAHAELQAAGTGAATVSDIARHWGFNHMGRFSAEYTERFGQYPHRTLRA